MGLSCSCDWDGEGWYFFGPDQYTVLGTKRARRCCSCKVSIKAGDLCAKFLREVQPDPDSIEARIYGDEKPLAPWFMCERCADLYFSLDELGYCIFLGDDMRELVKEYAAMRGA